MYCFGGAHAITNARVWVLPGIPYDFSRVEILCLTTEIQSPRSWYHSLTPLKVGWCRPILPNFAYFINPVRLDNGPGWHHKCQKWTNWKEYDEKISKHLENEKVFTKLQPDEFRKKCKKSEKIWRFSLFWLYMLALMFIYSYITAKPVKIIETGYDFCVNIFVY